MKAKGDGRATSKHGQAVGRPAPNVRERGYRLYRLRVTVVFLLAVVGCSKDAASRKTSPDAPQEAKLYFETCRHTGVDFVHDSGKSKRRLMPELTGSGIALIDLDDDGRLDLYFLTQGPLLVENESMRPTNRAFRNRGDMRFEDVTSHALLDVAGPCFGACAADFNNDGFVDLYLTRYGVNAVLYNCGDGTFTRRAGDAFAPHDAWSTGCAPFDGDGDGDLDLYVAAYADYDVRNPTDCGHPPGAPPSFCMPREVQPHPDAYYVNNGEGAFTDATAASGLAGNTALGFQVVAAHLNEDDFIDLYVANDVYPNFVYLGTKSGVFNDWSLESCASFSAEGNPEGSMGVAVEDVNGDGKPEVVVTNYRGQLNTLYANLGDAVFEDATRRFSLGGSPLLDVAWGIGLVDFDNDGLNDLFVSNGHIDDHVYREFEVEYRQFAKVWWNSGGRFVEQSRQAGPYFAEGHVGRACTFADLDGDGGTDVVLNNIDEPATILRNRSPRGNRVVVRCVGKRSNRDGLGTRIALHTERGVIHRQVQGVSSYLSGTPPWTSIGYGDSTVKALEAIWPASDEPQEVQPQNNVVLIEPVPTSGP